MRISSEVWLLALAVIFFAGTTDSALNRLPVLRNGDSAGLENPNARAERAETFLSYRLPNETYPEHYDITLTTNVHTGEKPFQGVVVIDIVVETTTSNIVLHARQLDITKATIADRSTGVSEELSTVYELEREFLTLASKSGKQFDAGTKWKLTITYSGNLRDDNGGFYLSKYFDTDGNDRYLATTQFESTDARHAFPCYDEPAKRANFTITINHSPTYTAISNMPVNAALSTTGKTVFLTTARISTYIVAFIVSDFEYTEGILNNIPQRVYSRPSAKHEHEWAVVSGMLITERLSEYYGVDFMLPKMDQVAIPDFAAGGMENWGLATYREEYLLYNKDTSTVFTQTNIANIAAHEICHQWFGDFVAIKWWSYLWLKEGFATFFSYRALEDAYPEWGVWQEFHANDYQTALVRDGSNSPRPMTHYVQKPREISSLYDSVSYGKAGAVLLMWSHALTEKVFRQGLHNYLTINQYSSAVEEQLFSAIQTAAKEENYKIPATISEMMGTWTRQGGYPLLTVTRNYSDSTFIVRQEAFHNDETFKSNKTWFVPINFAVASNPDFRNTEASHYLLNVTEIKVDDAQFAKGDWLVLNKQSTGYYRINYDKENWNLIADGLIARPFKFHPRNRAQLMHDAYYLSVSNRLDHAILLKIMTYLQQEDQYAPWATASGIVNVFNRFLSGDAKYSLLKAFVADQIGPIYEKLGVNDVPGEHHYQKYTRNVVINMACLMGVRDCLQETNNKLNALVKYNTPIEPNLQTPIYCNGLKQSGDEEFNFVFNKLMKSTDQALRRVLVSSLGCSQNENQIKKFIYSSIDDSNQLRAQERYTLLRPAYSRGEVGLLACIEFLNENWNVYGNLKSGFGGSNPLDDDIRGMSAYVVNKNQQEKLLALVSKVKDSEHVTSTLESFVKSTIADNYEWLEDNREPLISWMIQYFSKSGSESLAVSSMLFTSAFVMTAMRLF